MVRLFAALVSLLVYLYQPMAFAMSSIEEPDKIKWRPEIAEQRKPVEGSKPVIEEIKSKEPFINMQEEKIWSFEEDKEDDKSIDSLGDFGWLDGFVKFLAMLIEAVLWVIPLVIIYYLYRYREVWMNLVQGKGFRTDKADIADTLFGLDVTRESLPDDIQFEAANLWHQGQHREAICLLYRGALAALLRVYAFNLPPGATEEDCLRQVEQHQYAARNEAQPDVPDRAGHFRRLTGLWINVAYAHRLPVEPDFLAICNSWNQTYGDAMELG